MAQYKVPQNVQRDDKIIGPFTLRQFLFLISGSFAGYMVYSIFNKLIGGTNAFMIGFVIFLFVAAFAVLQVQGMSLPEYLAALIVFNTKPRKRVWQKDIFTPDIAFLKPEEKKEEPENIDPTQVRSRLDQLSYILDTRGWSQTEIENVETTQTKTSNNEIESEKAKIENAETVSKKSASETQIAPQLEKNQEEVPPPPKIEIAEDSKELEQVTEQKIQETDKILSTRTKISPPTEQKQEEIEKLLEIQEERERAIRQEMSKMEERLTEELKKKFAKQTQEQTKIQKQKIKNLKSSFSSIEKDAPDKQTVEKVKKAEIRQAPQITQIDITPDYTNVMENRITTPKNTVSHMNIKVNESQLDDVLSEIENPTTDDDFEKIEEAILAKKHLNKHARIIKESETSS
jgi:hypothetical protein